MLKERIRFEKRDATMLTVDFSGSIEDYALAWLKLTNNAREYPDMIWRISNDKGNNVYVICNPKSAKAVKDFCTDIISGYNEKENAPYSIGKVIDEMGITVGVPIYEYYSTYDCDDERWEDDLDKAIYEWMPVEMH